MKTGRKNNRGFTLVEIVIIVSIFVVLLGIAVPSLNSILGFRVQRTARSIGTALDKAKTEAMSRLAGEMMLEKREDGYYISFYLDRGKSAGLERMKQEQPEKIAPGNLLVQIRRTDAEPKEMEVGDSLILTFNREDGSFRPIQTNPLTKEEITNFIDNENHPNIVFQDELFNGKKVYCEEIIVSGGFRTRVVTLNQATGSYTITAG